MCHLFLAENLSLQMVARRRYNQIKKRTHYDDGTLLDEVMKERRSIEEDGEATMWQGQLKLGGHAVGGGRRGVRISENSRNLGYG